MRLRKNRKLPSVGLLEHTIEYSQQREDVVELHIQCTIKNEYYRYGYVFIVC